jgi:hypothetical protein
MNLTNEISEIIGNPEGDNLIYKAVLPTSRTVAQMISALANTNGGYIVLGVIVAQNKKTQVIGLSEDFHANAITHKALDMTIPKAEIGYEYVQYKKKKVYAIKVSSSASPILVEGKAYIRKGDNIILSNPNELQFKSQGYERIKEINNRLEIYRGKSTDSKIKWIEHCQSILKIIDDLGEILYPENTGTPTNHQEGKILSRILFSSFVDNFETYLADLLYEIFLASPSTLKSTQTITIEEVLNCTDLQEFIKYLSKKKIEKLQKGSVKGFIKENKQISALTVIDEDMQVEIERILQIRHLYSHRNGIVDEKFLQYFVGTYSLNAEHKMCVEEICEKLLFLNEMAHLIDSTAIARYRLAKT